MQEKTIIKVPHSVRKQIILMLGTSYPTVRRALNGIGQSELVDKIRKIAMENGGVEFEKVEK